MTWRRLACTAVLLLTACGGPSTVDVTVSLSPEAADRALELSQRYGTSEYAETTTEVGTSADTEGRSEDTSASSVSFEVDEDDLDRLRAEPGVLRVVVTG